MVCVLAAVRVAAKIAEILHQHEHLVFLSGSKSRVLRNLPERSRTCRIISRTSRPAELGFGRGTLAGRWRDAGLGEQSLNVLRWSQTGWVKRSEGRARHETIKISDLISFERGFPTRIRPDDYSITQLELIR